MFFWSRKPFLIARSAKELEAFRSEMDGTVAFVPTMGALHEGHLSLVDEAKKHGAVMVSIYVNPTQFAPDEDFGTYPRNIKRDLKMLKKAGVDLVFLPEDSDIYPNGPEITIKAGAAAQGLESDFRPGFFDGVCSVVSRLFELVKPDIAVFGEKDYQQLMAIREMVETRSVPVKIIGAPIIRDFMGLALSSRNAYLNADELEIARRLNVVLKDMSSRWRAEGASTNGIHKDRSEAADTSGSPQYKLAYARRGDDGYGMLRDAGFTKVDYVEERWGRILAAAWIGGTRLIDNVTTEITE